MACSVTRFILNLEVYIGATNEAILVLPQHTCGSKVGEVSQFTSGWEHLHHTVIMENFFFSPMLFEDLLTRGFYVVGTIRKGRVG